MLKKLSKSIREFKLSTILTLFFIVGEVIIEVLIPFITADLVNEIKKGSDIETVIKTGLLLSSMAILSLAFGGIAGFTCAKASAGFAKNLRGDVFRKIQSYSFENIDKFSSASLVTRLTTDIGNVQMSFMMLIRTAIRSPLMLIFSFFMAFYMGGKMAFAFVVVVPFLAFGLIMVARKAMPAFRSVFKKYDKLNESIEENVRGMRVVKGFSREEYEKEKFNTAAEEIRKDFTKAERIVALNTPIMQICLYFIMVFVLLVGSNLSIVSNTIDVGQISAILTYGMQILMSLMMLSMIFVMLTLSTESAKRICEVLDEEPSLKNRKNPIYSVPNGSVEFKNVSFKYSKQAEKYSLENVNLKIESGMTVGIIGGTGSSKSTLVQLIPRLYDATVGDVFVGGVNVKDFDLDTLRHSVAMVLQKNLLFSGTIKENLLWGNEKASDDEIIEACKLSMADEFIQTFPEKYDTKIEQGGTNVSGGQKQRLCIARALLRKPKILILDDSTSAVDTKTDAAIRAGLKKYIPETTKIIIAQRIDSVKESDIIIVMDNGKISSVGKHEELLKSSDIYREVYEQQTKGGSENE
ncbi:MAG: ABC transporter ATP-binding protein [Ruminococcaceae bacterium]|nr:ABC transporter ATP-binding protein [Oscillospiraceae bacterium]